MNDNTEGNETAQEIFLTRFFQGFLKMRTQHSHHTC